VTRVIYRRLSLGTALLILVGLGYVGLRNGLAEWSNADTTGQRLASMTEALYGLLGLVAGVGLVTRRTWTVPVVVAWAVSVTITAGLAPVVWGGAGIRAGVAAAAATTLIVLGVIWLARRALAA
jgi:hypothetical protein